MTPRMIDELARQHHAELLATASGPRPENLEKSRRPAFRITVGWAIVAIGLRIAALP